MSFCFLPFWYARIWNSPVRDVTIFSQHVYVNQEDVLLTTQVCHEFISRSSELIYHNNLFYLFILIP